MYDNNPFRLAKQLVQEANKQFKTYENCLEYYMDKGLSEDAARKECNAQEAENIGESNERLAKQDPREFGSEPFDQEDMASLRDQRTIDAITNHHNQYIMHTAHASDPNKSEQERAAHRAEANKHLKEKKAHMAVSGLNPQLSNNPADVPVDQQNAVKESEEIENLLDLIEALCEELDIDSDTLLEGYGNLSSKMRGKNKRRYEALVRSREGAKERAEARGERYQDKEPLGSITTLLNYANNSATQQQAAADPRSFPPGSPKTADRIRAFVNKRNKNQQYEYPYKG